MTSTTASGHGDLALDSECVVSTSTSTQAPASTTPPDPTGPVPSGNVTA